MDKLKYCKMEKCINKNTEKCECCERNAPPMIDNYQYYKPVCPQGFLNCVRDPAYIQYHYPEWYKEMYGDLTPEEAAVKYCNEENNICYDGKDKCLLN